eukprot:137317-Prorocentrum_minimum.AAC.7
MAANIVGCSALRGMAAYYCQACQCSKRANMMTPTSLGTEMTNATGIKALRFTAVEHAVSITASTRQKYIKSSVMQK